MEKRRFYTRKEAADLLRLKPGTLACWASRGNGPDLKPVHIHGRVLYRVEAVEALLEGAAL